MTLKEGDMFSRENIDMFSPKLLVVTTNAVVKKNGALVMGAGAAKALLNFVPGIDKEFGREILLHRRLAKENEPYGFINVFLPERPEMLFGALQVKWHYKDNAQLDLIRFGLEKLKYYAKGFKFPIFLNFPGIGLGNLDTEYDTILKELKKLPDNVIVWKLDR